MTLQANRVIPGSTKVNLIFVLIDRAAIRFASQVVWPAGRVDIRCMTRRPRLQSGLGRAQIRNGDKIPHIVEGRVACP